AAASVPTDSSRETSRQPGRKTHPAATNRTAPFPKSRHRFAIKILAACVHKNWAVSSCVSQFSECLSGPSSIQIDEFVQVEHHQTELLHRLFGRQLMLGFQGFQ